MLFQGRLNSLVILREKPFVGALRSGKFPFKSRPRCTLKVNSEGTGTSLSLSVEDPNKDAPLRESSAPSLENASSKGRLDNEGSSIGINGASKGEDTEAQALREQRSSSAHAETADAMAGSTDDRKVRRKGKASSRLQKGQACAEDSVKAPSEVEETAQKSASLNGAGPPRSVAVRDTKPGALQRLAPFIFSPTVVAAC